jgi:acid phosphatase type 7
MKHQSPGKKDFAILNGDILSKTENEDQIINHLINPLTDLFATTAPFMFGRGNHETWGADSRNLRNYFDGRENKFYYSFQYGPMYGIVMDSGETKADTDPANGGIVDFDDYRETQGKWLAKEVQKEAFKKAKYKIVFIHIPPYYLAEEAHAPNQYNKLWGPIFNASKIDLMLCGHTHRYGIHQPTAGRHNYPIVIGGGPTDGKRTMIDIKVTKQSLNLKMRDDSGNIVGTLKL